jgi:2-oxoglutarate/2-oxoacid ferredoxin oxidoreductase subunit alpha
MGIETPVEGTPIGEKHARNPIQEVESVVIRFAGDSGDGMQATGSMFTHTAAIVGNDISTFPDFPAEIRAPAGTLPGVSAFQLNFSAQDIRTPGDAPSVLVAMNPASLKTNLADLIKGGMVIINEDAFIDGNFKKAEMKSDPRQDGTLAGYQVIPVPITRLTTEAVKPADVTKKEADLAKNMFALGLLYWLYDRPLENTLKRIEQIFAKKSPKLVKANQLALQAGYSYAETVELFRGQFRVAKAKLPAGKYRRITGNEALALGLVAASQLSGRPLFYGSYPITPASDILHELSRLKNFGVKTFQAEDEIAAVGATIGASFGGALAVTGTSGPGVALKSEAIGLAVMTELPLVVINVQRGGPSTGLPTKTEQADLFQAIMGRHGESPVCVIAPATPGDCFAMVIEAARIAIRHMVPVMFLSDGYLANGSEPWRIPELDELAPIPVQFRTEKEGFHPYSRDQATLARPWAVPGTPGLEHRIGGIEKQHITGNISYDPQNHEHMVKLRAEKVARVADFIPELEVMGAPQGDLLVVGWGSTYGAITTAVERAQRRGGRVSSIHLRHLNPFPRNFEKLLRSFEKVLVVEMNLGQLRFIIQGTFLVQTEGLNKVQGQPFRIAEVEQKIEELL